MPSALMLEGVERTEGRTLGVDAGPPSALRRSTWPSRSTTSRPPGASTWRSSAAASGGRTPTWIDFDLHGHQIVAHLDPRASASPRRRRRPTTRRRRRRARAPLRPRRSSGTPGTSWPSASARPAPGSCSTPTCASRGARASRPRSSWPIRPATPLEFKAFRDPVPDLRPGALPMSTPCRHPPCRHRAPIALDAGLRRAGGHVRSAPLVLGGRAVDRQPQLLGRHGRSLRRPPRRWSCGASGTTRPSGSAPAGRPARPATCGPSRAARSPPETTADGLVMTGRAVAVPAGRRRGPGAGGLHRPSTARRSPTPGEDPLFCVSPELVLATPEAGLHHPPHAAPGDGDQAGRQERQDGRPLSADHPPPSHVDSLSAAPAWIAVMQDRFGNEFCLVPRAVGGSPAALPLQRLPTTTPYGRRRTDRSDR